MNFYKELDLSLNRHSGLNQNLGKQQLIEKILDTREALITESGALACWTPPESTGRSPKDTYIVNRASCSDDIDWNSPNNIKLTPETFTMICQDALEILQSKKNVYLSEKVIGADPNYALPVTTISDSALTALFTDNMFRPVPKNIRSSRLFDQSFTLLVFPYDKLKKERYNGKLRTLADGSTSDLIVAMDFEQKVGIIIGSAYMGSVKKLMFTVMNYMLPGIGILPLHASANEGQDNDIALFLGLSGTGKTTLSADPERALLGDDEHGWSDDGIANFENGCYAKLINLSAKKEPEIYNAIMHRDSHLNHGAIVENVMVYPNGRVDLYDSRLTENSRGSYPLSFLTNIKDSSCGSHPKRIIFLTADANGVLPPVALLGEHQAMLWFLMGYTSKLAGTETGIVEPVSTFSRFFGEPFMPRNPDVYASMLGEKMKKHGTRVFLVNTGWSGGPYGTGRRMDISITRKIIQIILKEDLQQFEFQEDPRFHILVPLRFPGIPENILHPKKSWKDPAAFTQRADMLAAEFAAHFDKAYGSQGLDPRIISCCPGK